MTSSLEPPKPACRAALFLGVMVAALGAAVLTGWLLDVAAVKTVLPGAVTMKANTALGFLLSGMALALLSGQKGTAPFRLGTMIIAVVVITLGSLTLVEYLAGWNPGLDQWLFRDVMNTVDTSQPGRMSPTSALCFVLTGGVLLAATRLSTWRFGFSIFAALSASLVAVGVLTLASRVTGVLLQAPLWDYAGLAIHTSAGFVLLGCGFLALARNEGRLAWSLDRVTTGGFAIGIVSLVTSAAISYHFTDQLQQSAALVSRTQEVLKVIAKVTAGVSAFGSSQRSFINTGDEHFLAQEKENEDALRKDVAEARKLTAGDAQQQKLLDQLETLIAERIAWGEQTVAARRLQGLSAAEKIIASGAGVSLSNRIRRVIQEMEDGEYATLGERQKKEETVSKTTFLLLPLGVFLSLTMLCLGLFFLNTGMGERARAEEKATWLASFPQQNPNPIVELDPATGIIHYVNPSAIALLPDLPQLGLRHPWLAGSQDASAVLVGKPGESLQREIAVEGLCFAQTINYVPETGRMRVYGTDITERKQMEAAAKRLAAIVESSDDAIISKNLDGIITSWNRGAQKLFGYSAGEAIGKSMLMLFPPELASEESEIIARISRGESLDHFESVRVRKDGTRIDVSITLSPVRDDQGKVVGASKIARDITDRKLSENKLQAQLGRLHLLNHITRAIGERQDLPSIHQVVIRSLEDDLPVDFICICVYDQSANALTVVRAGLKTAATARELALCEQAVIPIDENGLSRCVRGQLVYEPDTSPVPFPFPQRLARAGLRSFVAAPLQVESKVFGVLLAARRPPGSFVSGECEFLKQLSEHVALASHQSQLYDALQLAYEDLRKTQQAVLQQERLRALGQMASGIAHDINNAISPAALYTQSLLEREPGLSPRARDYLQTIQQAVEDVAATVARMREFYRHREPQLTLAQVKLNELVRQVTDLTRPRWNDMPQQRGIVVQLRTELSPDLPAIMGVESEIRDALANLILNAVDAMPEGGTLTIRTRVEENPPDPVEAPLPRRILLEVADTGVGMTEATRRRCLEPFFTTKGERGTGLGLAMVYGMVQRHSAEIELESTVGKGTTVRISFGLPATQEDGLVQHPVVPTAPPRMRILVVDDDPVVLKSLRDVLENDGHAVTAVNGGQEGIDTVRASSNGAEPFAVVITDLGMPYVDGRQVAAAVKADSPATSVILLTGWGQRLVTEGDVPAHVDRVLSKPPKLLALREALVQCSHAGPPGEP